MDMIDELKLCDVLYLGSAVYDDPGQPNTLGTLWFIDKCVSKKIGELAFTLNPSDHLGIHEVDADLLFNGAVVGASGPDPVVRWTVNQSVSVLGSDVNVTGHFDTVLRKEPRHMIPACNDPQKTFGVTLSGTNADKSFLSASGTFLSKTFKQLSLDAEGGRKYVPPVLSASIEIERDECGIGAGPGQRQSFLAHVGGASPADITLAWSVSGNATATGATDDWLFRVTVGQSPDPYTVTLKASADGATVTTTRTYVPEDEKSIALKSFICRIRRDVIHHMFVDPLWDPIRDPSVDGPGPHGPRRIGPLDLKRNIAVAQRLARSAEIFLRAVGAPLHGRDHETKR
jgi:hypothetical protein